MSQSIVGGELGRAVDTLAREELGIDPDELGGSAWVAAITSFFLFALGAIVPVSPFFFASGMGAVVVSIAVSAAALMLVGAAITVVTGSSVLRTGGRQVLLGMFAAAVTFGWGAGRARSRVGRRTRSGRGASGRYRPGSADDSIRRAPTARYMHATTVIAPDRPRTSRSVAI